VQPRALRAQPPGNGGMGGTSVPSRWS
jgi:hypothetical protein